MGKTEGNEKKILFEAPLIKALLHNRKSRSRRVVLPQPKRVQRHIFSNDYSKFTDGGREYKCPYGGPGDLVWVPEPWQVAYGQRGAALIYGIDMTVRHIDPALVPVGISHDVETIKSGNGPWRSPARMPRSCTRLLFSLAGVRVLRVQQLSDEAAVEGGIWKEPGAHPKPWACWYAQPEISSRHGMILPRPGFAKLWNDLYGKPRPVKRNPFTNQKEDCWVSFPWQEEQGTETYENLPHYIIGNPYVWDLELARVKEEAPQFS